MAKGMKTIAGLSIIIFAIFTAIYQIKPLGIILTIAITSGTIAYHFWMRLIVGGIFDLILHNKVDYNKKWFKQRKFEQKLYKVLKVKEWKKHLPTYDPNAFDKSKHSWSEILGAMCQSELVHETNVIFSFLPVIFSLWFGETLVFVLTSIFSALFDLMFVMIQRYNRPRVLKLVNCHNKVLSQ